MVRLSSSLALLGACVLPLAQAGPFSALYSTTDSVARFGLRKVLRLNETQIDRVLRTEVTPLEPHPYAVDLTDDNFETILATGTENPFAPTLPKDDIWIITVFGPDPISKPFLEGMNNVSLRHSHKAGGSLPANVHFARLNYASETILPTQLWVWRTPVIVIGMNRMQTLRFIKPGHVMPQEEALVELLSKPRIWQQLPPWSGVLAPGGRFEPHLRRVARIWARIHRTSAKLPSVVLLALSGFIMNFVVSWFHKDDAKLQAEFNARKAAAAKEGETATDKEPTAVKAKATATLAKKGANKRKRSLCLAHTGGRRFEMASWVAKAVQYYKDINPATLTGAIDVIVVERPTESGQVELACSPFHVRFGKLSVLRPVDKKVRIAVNDERIPFYMKVGETGEAFFVFETEDDVPADMQTSPLSGPLSDDGRSDAGEVEPLDLDAPAMDLDEGEAGTSEEQRREQDADEDAPKTPVPSAPVPLSPPPSTSFANASPTATLRSFPSPPFPGPAALPRARSESPSPLASPKTQHSGSSADSSGAAGSHGRRSTPPGRHVPSPVSNAAAQLAATGAAALRRPAQEFHDARLKHRFREDASGAQRRDSTSDYQLKGEGAEVGQPEDDVRNKLAGISLNDSKAPSEETGDAVIEAARRKNADTKALLGGRDGGGETVAADGTLAHDKGPSLEHYQNDELHLDADQILRDARGERGNAAPEDTGALMLDMSGYKVEAEKDEIKAKSKGAEQELESEVSRMGIDDRAEKDIIAFTQALLQSTDPTTLGSFFDGTDELSRAATPIPPLDLAETTRDSDSETRSRRSGSVRSERAASPGRPVSIYDLQSLHAEAEGSPAPDDGVYQAAPMQFSLKSGGTVFIFELSLCGSDGLEHLEKAAAERLFSDHQITFNNFIEQDAIPENPDLVVKFSGRYLTWDNASPVLASLAVYRKSLLAHPEHHKHVRREGESSEAAKTHRRGWSLWWSRGRSAPPPDVASTSSLPTEDTSSVATPPTSVPASPKSLPEDVVSPAPATEATKASEGDEFPLEDHTKHYAKTLRLTSDQLKTLGLKKGMNTVSFSVRSSYSGYATCTSRIFLWESDFQVVISDIDGTITKSDALGHVFTMIGRDWTHLGVAKLYTDISRNGYKLMYLTSRAIGQADTTREYLKGIKQNGYQLPEGPVIMSPDRLMTSLHREVIMRKPEVFKMACLRDISRLFGERSPFYAGFGNRITDALSYRSVDIPSSRIFTIDSNGEVKMELLELAGYKSSYIHMTDLVDQMFPPITRNVVPDYSDFNFWRTPLPAIDIDIPELAPPSPALSARSDQSTSRLSLGRLGNLASSLSRRGSRGALTESASATSRIARAGTPTSPLLQATVPEETYDLESGLVQEEYEEEDFDANRSRSSSMPGSMPNESDFDRYRAIAAARGKNGQGDSTTPAEEYKRKVRGDVHGDEEEYDDDEEVPADEDDIGADDFGDQLDFSSVPYL
ncbi:hypothetical protein JCM10908_004080 [Rhodotorula pacifica]|uniref:phosphatidate phosphatase PAH1 n=1 Tax=Rhodotorula pacifica TaxID=1495444 RepID=UPI0031793F53